MAKVASSQGITNVDPRFPRIGVSCRVNDDASEKVRLTDCVNDELIKHAGRQFAFRQISIFCIEYRVDLAVFRDGKVRLSNATKNQPLSQGGWVGCDFLIATCGLIKLED